MLRPLLILSCLFVVGVLSAAEGTTWQLPPLPPRHAPAVQARLDAALARLRTPATDRTTAMEKVRSEIDAQMEAVREAASAAVGSGSCAT